MLHLDATHIGAGVGVGVVGVLMPASRVVEVLVPASSVLTGGVAGVVGTGVLMVGVLVLVLVGVGTLTALLL